MKTTLMTCSVDARGAAVLGAVVLGSAAVRERSIAPTTAPVHGTALSATAQGAAFGTALPGPPRGAPV